MGIPDFRIMSKRFFTWNITYNCNYQCSYCHAPKPDSIKTSIISLDEWLKIWNNIYARYGECEMVISGGEPFVYPGFLRIVKETSKWHIVELCTNLYWDVEEFVADIKPERVRFGTSFHPEYAELDKFLKKIKILRDSGFETFVNFVSWPPFLPEMKGYKRKIEAAGTRFMLQLFRGHWEGRRYPEGYTEEELKYFDDEILDDETNRAAMKFNVYENHKWNIEDNNANHVSPKGKICHMGESYGYILPDGTVWRCCSHKSGVVGNVLHGDFRLLSGPSPCVSEICHCERRMVAGEEGQWIKKWRK